MQRSDLLALLNDKYNSSLYDLILDRLEFFHYEVQESDVPMLVQCLLETENDIRVNCNIDVVPHETMNITISGAVVADFLSFKKMLNQLDISSLDLNTAVASVSMGNTSVSYNVNDSDSAKFDILVNTLKNKLRSLYPCLKKIQW